jgi:hypothetical protein
VVKRRVRTRHLIELGGLVVRRLVEITDDDRAALLRDEEVDGEDAFVFGYQ